MIRKSVFKPALSLRVNIVLLDVTKLDHTETLGVPGCLHPAHHHPGVVLGVQLADLVLILAAVAPTM